MLQQLKFGFLLMALLSTPTVALAQTGSSSTPILPVDPIDAASRRESNRQPASRPTSQEPLAAQPPVCPTGYFASKFPDVSPEDWAYEAVNRLAGGEFRCFPQPSQ